MNPNPSQFSVRRVRVSERQQVVDIIEKAFTPADGPRRRLSAEMPHLFCDVRIPNHFVAEQDGRIVGVVGLYPHQIRIHDVVFDVAGVGQVATAPAARGGGVMSGILQEVCRVADQLDFTWLFGDRRRYGRYGWEFGGLRHVFETFDKYLPPPPPAGQVAPFAPSAAAERLQSALKNSPQAILFPDHEVEMLLQGVRGRRWRGWALNESFVILDGDTIIFGHGHYDELVGLLAHAAAELRKQPGDHWKLTLECDPEPGPLMRACLDCHWNHKIIPAAGFRIGNLFSFLTKACRLAQPAVDSGNERLELANSDNGQKVTLLCENGQLSIREGAGQKARLFNTTQLSQLCFGLGPLDLLLPELSPASPFRRVLPLKVGIGHLFSL